jgi:hypothetical protein
VIAVGVTDMSVETSSCQIGFCWTPLAGEPDHDDFANRSMISKLEGGEALHLETGVRLTSDTPLKLSHEFAVSGCRPARVFWSGYEG